MCLTGLPELVNATISQECIAKNASGVAMRMNEPCSKTRQTFGCYVGISGLQVDALIRIYRCVCVGVCFIHP